MLILRNPAAARRIRNPAIRKLVTQRFTQILAGESYDYDRHGYMIVVEGDTVDALEKETGCCILRNLIEEDIRFPDPDFAPSFEALEEHDECYEMLFVLNDEGFGITLFIPKAKGTDADLLVMCGEFARPASGPVGAESVRP